MKIFCYLSLLCTLVFTYSVHAQIITVTVTAPPYSFNSGVLSDFMNTNPQTASLGQADSASFIAGKIAEAKAQCSAAVDIKFTKCQQAAVKTLDTDQLGCAALGASAGVYGVIASSSTATGIGAPVGVVVGAFGAIQGAGAIYCYNHASNTKSLADISCNSDQKKGAAICAAIQ